MIKTKTVTGTTSANGSINLYLGTPTHYAIIDILGTSSDGFRCTPYVSSTGSLFAQVMKLSSGDIILAANIECTLTVRYFEL